MNKIFFFCCLSFLFISCFKKDENNSKNSIGAINTISLVMDDQLWNGSIGDSIRNKFARPVEGLSKEEPLFDINQYPISVMEGFVTKARTIIVVKKGATNHFEIQRNVYATPQTLIQITGKSLTDLLNTIEKKSPLIIKIIQEGEIKAHQLLLNDSLNNLNEIPKQFQLDLKVPKHYSIDFNGHNFIWLKHEFPYGNTNLLLTQYPLKPIQSNDEVMNLVTKVHDSINAFYIKDKMPSSCLYIDKSYPYYVSKVKIDSKPAYEIKGIWRLSDSFMFGSFVTYLILDPKNDRIVSLEGFSYVPSRERRDYMHELESIIKGVKLN